MAHVPKILRAMRGPQPIDETVDLFAGPGGWDEGVHDLGIRPIGIELDDAACDTASAAGHLRIQRDISALQPSDLFAPHGGLIASPPCQGFSMAGHGRGRQDAELLLAAIPQMLQGDDPRAGLHEHMKDDRSVLVLEPLRWALQLLPSWIAWEQVIAVQPIWSACADVLQNLGYSVDTGIVNAEQHGVPQTRRRAILVARAPWFAERYGPARLPVPTHSRFYPNDPTKLDPDIPPWVSMAEALGWGMTERPSMTVTGGGTGSGGAEPFGNAARQGVLREKQAGRWAQRSNYSKGGGPGATAEERGRSIRPDDQPSVTITSKPPQWALRNSNQVRAAKRRDDQPAPTLYFGHNSAKTQWHDPSTIDDMSANGIRITTEEAAVLQTFPADYPWQGSKGERYRQIGDAVPPLLARAIVSEIAARVMPAPVEAEPLPFGLLPDAIGA